MALEISFLGDLSCGQICFGNSSGSPCLSLLHRPLSFSVPLETAVTCVFPDENFHLASKSVPHTITVCSTSITQVGIRIIYNFALLSNDVWRISWMNSDCNCWGYWALSANYWAQMIAFKYSSQHTWNKKQLAQLCQWISLLLPMGLKGRGGKTRLHRRR